VNAPDSGTIKEFLVSEEDTVTVGQDLVKLELGDAPEGKKDAAPEQPKEPAAEKPQESAPAAEKPKAPEPEKPAPSSEKPKETPKKAESPKPQGAAESKPSLGNREERRVRTIAAVCRGLN
jgi:2-oxoglutarate dehydrogenase E2 component (dihydrolipoamide succinyltransferase)